MTLPGLDFAGPWLWVAALLLLVAGRLLAGAPGRASGPPVPGPTRLVAALFLVGAGLRLGLGFHGPLHVNGHAPEWVEMALGRLRLPLYGPGYQELYSWLLRSIPRRPDLALFAANGVLGALVCVILYPIGRRLGLTGWSALLVPAAAALDPVAVRTAATEGYFTPILLLSLLSAWALLASGDGFAEGWRGRAGAAALTVGGALAAVQAARIHPLAWAVLTVAPVCLALRPGAATPAQRLARGGAAAALLVMVAFLLSGDPLAAMGGAAAGRSSSPPAWNDTLRAWWLILFWLPVALTVAVWLVRQWRVRGPDRHQPAALLLVLAGLLYLVWLCFTSHLYGMNRLWEGCYLRLFAVVPALALVRLLPQRRAAVVLAGVLAFGAWWAPLAQESTEQLEYRFWAEQLERIPSRCRLTAIDSRLTNAGNNLPAYIGLGGELAPSGRLTARRPGGVAAAAPPPADGREGGESEPATCDYYLRLSACSLAGGQGPCAGLEAELPHGEPEATAKLPARPTQHEFIPEAVTLALHRLR